MRDFFILTHNSRRRDLQVVCDYELGDFDSTLLWSGKRLESIPDTVRLFVEHGKPSDYMGGPLTWDIVSERLLETFEKTARDDIQVFSAPLFSKETGQPVLGYRLINVIRCYDALAVPIRTIDDVVVMGSRVPSDVHIFKLVGEESLVLISGELAFELIEMKFQGVVLIKVGTQ